MLTGTTSAGRSSGGTTSDGYDVVQDGTRSGKNSFGDEFGDSRYGAVLFDLE